MQISCWQWAMGGMGGALAVRGHPPALLLLQRGAAGAAADGARFCAVVATAATRSEWVSFSEKLSHVLH